MKPVYATPQEVVEYNKVKQRIKGRCEVPDCLNSSQDKTIVVCEPHLQEFRAQRDSGIYDFRVWVIKRAPSNLAPSPSPILSSTDFAVAIRDANAQGILKTFMVELDTLLHDYDMQDTIFGEKVSDLMDTWHKEMND